MSLATNGDSVQAEISGGPHGNPAASLLAVWAPYLLALFFALSALRGVGSTDIIDTDAARHAMNGAFIYDLVRGGHLAHPVAYAKEYYSHLPALSMPYHPPMFPAIEALFFAVFGVKLLTARVAIAVSAGLCSWLLYRLVEATLGSRLLAICVTLTTWSLWTCQTVARDVMLEYPAMAFSLAALYFVRDLDRYTMRRALLFAVLASAAVWTKQHAVFLGAVPFFQAALARRWSVFRRSPIWVASAIFAAAVLALVALSKHFNGTGIQQVGSSANDAQVILKQSLPIYLRGILQDLKGLPGIFAAAALAAFLVRTRKPIQRAPALALYSAWAVAVCMVLAFLTISSARYLFFLLPAAIAIGYAWLSRGCSLLWGERGATFVVGGFAAAWFVTGLFAPIEFLRGPGASAQLVVQGSPTRVLYAGEADGNFIFAVRALDPQLQVTVVPGSKLPPKTFEPEALGAFCRQFDVDWVILEKGSRQHAWSSLEDLRPASLELERSIPLESNRSRWDGGTIKVYRFTGPKGNPGSVLDLPVRKLGGNIELKF